MEGAPVAAPESGLLLSITIASSSETEQSTTTFFFLLYARSSLSNLYRNQLDM
jgi:hypothetical protein